jgi:hypothetical protein
MKKLLISSIVIAALAGCISIPNFTNYTPAKSVKNIPNVGINHSVSIGERMLESGFIRKETFIKFESTTNFNKFNVLEGVYKKVAFMDGTHSQYEHEIIEARPYAITLKSGLPITMRWLYVDDKTNHPCYVDSYLNTRCDKSYVVCSGQLNLATV